MSLETPPPSDQPAAAPVAGSPVPETAPPTNAPDQSPPAQAAAPAPQSRSHRFWEAAKNISLILSMIVNLLLIIIVAVLLNQIGSIKTTLTSVLGQLDSAFAGLGQTVIHDSIAINHQVPVQFDLPLNQDTTVTTLQPVPINTHANFSLGPYGSINGTVSLNLPPGLHLPVHLQLTVPVSASIPVVFDQPVAIPVYTRGMGPVVDKLRAALGPVIGLVKQMPDRFVIIPQ